MISSTISTTGALLVPASIVDSVSLYTVYKSFVHMIYLADVASTGDVAIP